MKYVSLDIETTGLNPQRDQILQLAMVIEDTKELRPIEELPTFNVYVKHDEIHGNAYALGMNAWILDIISGRKDAGAVPNNVVDLETAVILANQFLTVHLGNKRLNVAGKNVAGFDMQFLPKALKDRFRHRCIDAGSVLINWDADQVYSLEQLVIGEIMHDAVEDARAVIRVLRTSYPNPT